MTKKVVKYGSWKSPITSDLIVRGTIGLGEIAFDGEDLYWIESRPSEGGRSVIVCRTPDGKVADVTPPDFNARTTVHEYGGGSYVVDNGTVYFSNFSDQQLYRQEKDQPLRAMTSTPKMRYADGVLDKRRKLIYCVREDHSQGGRDAINTLTRINLAGDSAGEVIVSGNDFYSSPRLSPDGKRLAWLSWIHPNMPWDGTELWFGELDEAGRIAASKCVAGGRTESIFQPEWSPAGILHFVSDRTGWWNLYRLGDERIEPLCPRDAEFGLPQWAFGMSTYGFASASELVCSYAERGEWRPARLATDAGALTPIDVPFVTFSGLRVADGRAFFVGGAAASPTALVELDLASGAHQVVRSGSTLALDPGYVSVAQAI